MLTCPMTSGYQSNGCAGMFSDAINWRVLDPL
jgi:hypothetical protein